MRRFLRELLEDEVIAGSDFCWSKGENPKKSTNTKFQVNEEFAGKTPPLVRRLHLVPLNLNFYTDRIDVFRIVKDNEIIEKGDCCGKWYRAESIQSVPLNSPSTIQTISNSDILGIMTGATARNLYTEYQFFTTRRRNDPIFDKPFGLLKSLM